MSATTTSSRRPWIIRISGGANATRLFRFLLISSIQLSKELIDLGTSVDTHLRAFLGRLAVLTLGDAVHFLLGLFQMIQRIASVIAAGPLLLIHPLLAS